MKIGILRETKVPPDRRVPLTPEQCAKLNHEYTNTRIVVQSSPDRCYTDDEYLGAGVTLQDDLSDCDLLMGVKEVKTTALIANKSYLFFSHTAKEQPYNRRLLQEIAKKGITLIDYEYLTREDNTRVVAFGKWAGIVGAYNGLRTYGLRTGHFSFPPASELQDYEMLLRTVESVRLRKERIILTGGGRVAGGAVEVLQAAGIRQVSPEDFLQKDFDEAIFSRLDPWHYTRRKDGATFDFDHFIQHPKEYENTFQPYTSRSHLYIACHFWDPDAPVLMTREEMQQDDFNIRVIADISCDINGPIPSTIRASTIADPVYGYDPDTGKESADSFSDNIISVMAVDNLPGELPRNASKDFGEALVNNVIPYFVSDDKHGIIERATIVRKGSLTKRYAYLEDYLKGK